MEREPLLRGKKSGRRYSRKPSADENTENSVYSYCGDNFTIPQPDRRKPRSLTVDTQTSVEELPPRRFHRPLFIGLVTIIHFGLIIYICVAGGIETIGFKPDVKNLLINKFGFIASTNTENGSIGKGYVYRYSGVNGFIGPNTSFLVQIGAKFGPCMKKLIQIEKRVKAIQKDEADFVCCSYKGECGMMNNASCLGVITKNCSSSSLNCTHGVTLRPCCLGLHSQCHVISQTNCSFQGGHWHKDKLLCSDVNCLDDICEMSGVKDKTGGHQWYRLITPIFLHLGIIHLITNLFFQIPVGILIEREIGTVRTCLIYLISGIGGNLFCGLFNPLTPQVGASGALFGLIGFLIVKLLLLRHDVKRPCCEALFLLGVALASFALGTLPYIGNFVHIGGFLFGIFASLALLPRMTYRFRNLAVNTSLKGIFIVILLVLLVGMFVAFFLVKNVRKFCSWCHYVDCVPYTTNFCPDMDSDGFSDKGTYLKSVNRLLPSTRGS